MYTSVISGDIKAEDAHPLSLQSISNFLFYAAGVTALKYARLMEGGDIYTVRANPSSGGLHPSEIYVLLPPGVVTGEDGALLTHYKSLDHALQVRARVPTTAWDRLNLDRGSFVVCVGSIYWREVWKYGMRGFRYTLLDMGHLMASVTFAAQMLSWTSKVSWHSQKDFLIPVDARGNPRSTCNSIRTEPLI